MKIFARRAPLDAALSLLMCAGLMAPLSACNLFRKKSSSSTKATATAAKAMTKILDEYGSSVNDTIGADKNYVIGFKVLGSNFTAGLAKLSVMMNALDSVLFEKTQLTVSMSVTIRHSDGSTEKKSSAQPVKSDKSGIYALGMYMVRQGDVLEVAVEGIPDVLTSAAYIYVEASLLAPETKGRDSLSASDSWSAQKTLLAGSTEEASQRVLNVTERSLYTFDSYITAYRPSTEMSVRGDDLSTSCFTHVGAVGSGTISSALAGKPWSVAFSPKEAESSGPGCEAFSGTATVENDAAPTAFDSKIMGIVPNETVVTFRYTGSNEDDYTQSKLGTVDVQPQPSTSSSPSENTGRYEKQKVSYIVKGVQGSTGLSLQLSGSFVFPTNIPEIAASTFDGKGLGATLRYASGPKAGQAVADAAGAPLQVFTLADTPAPSRQFASFDAVRLPDLEDGDYEVTVDFPSNFPSGVYASFSLMATRPGETVGKLDPAVIADFKARDVASGAVVHEWPQADYSAGDKPEKREPIALVAVAKAMEEIRDSMHLMVNDTNPWTGAHPARSVFSNVEMSAIVNCLGSNQAPHWSDLTLHYYCLINQARGCYTTGIRNTAGYMQKVQAEEAAKGGGEAAIKGAIACRLPSMKRGPVTLPVLTFDPNFKYPTLRQYVFNQCGTDPNVDIASHTNPASAIPGCLARTDIEAYVPSIDDRKQFSWFVNDAERAKTFRYIMEAPTFAFTEKDQQDIINAFYRVTKPSDPADCSKRPRRAIDKAPTSGKPTVCEVGHDQDPPRAAAGR